MKLLLILAPSPNLVPDMLLHGLRKIFGDQVVDFPRKDTVYDGIMVTAALGKVPNLMAPDDGVDREDIPQKLKSGYFDMIVVDVRIFNEYVDLLQEAASPIALLDGEDFPIPITPGRYAILRRETDGTDFSIPIPISIPVELIRKIDGFAGAAKTYSVGFLGGRTQYTSERNQIMDGLAQLFPDGMIGPWAAGQTAPGNENYFANLQRCHVVVSLPGAGRDTLRYWENAASSSVHAALKMPLFIPDDFRDGKELLRFSRLFELAERVEEVLSGRIDAQAMAQRSREWLLTHHTTEKRALYAIDRLRRTFGI